MKRKPTSIFKPFIFALIVAFVALAISPVIFAGVTGKQDAQKAEAFEDGYKVTVEIQTLYGSDQYLSEAKIYLHTKKDQGRGEANYSFYESEDITDEIKDYGSTYTTKTINCGKEFPYYVSLYTNHAGEDWEYYSGDYLVIVTVNGVTVAYSGVSCSGMIWPELWGGMRGREDNVWIPEDKYPQYVSNNADQYGVYLAPPAVTYETNYRVKVNIRVTNDCDDWNSAYIWVYTKRDNGVGDSYLRYTSADIKTGIDYTDANYTHETLKTGIDFPYSVHIKTDIGTWGQYHYGEADVTVYINDINVASKHISYGGWSRCRDENEIEIDQSKYPAPKTWHAYYSNTVDPSEEESTLVNLTPVDQYGVAWTQNVSVRNESLPGEDLAEKLDDKGFKWKLSSTKTDNHTTNYYFSTNTGSNVYPTSEHKVTVKFVFPLHVYVKLNGETVFTGSGYAGETIEIPDIDTPVGYVIDSYKRDSGVGAIEKNEDGKFTYTFTGDTSTFIAKTKAIAYTVKYDPNIAEGDTLTGRMLDKTANYGKTFALATNQFKRTGYTFVGWNTAPDGSGKAYSKQEKVSNLASEKGAVVTLYAQWQPTDASVTASLFTDGSLALIFGGVVVEVAAIIIIVSIIARKRKRF